MPLFSYICKECSEKFDLLIGMTFQKTELKCNKCGSKKIEKIFSSFSVGSSEGKSSSSGETCPTGTCDL